MRSFLLFLVSGAVLACSSSSDPAPTSDAAADTAVASDVGKDTAKAPTDTTVDDATDDTTIDDTDGVDTKPPADKCAGKTCTGSYQACCATTGACYDTRCASCCY